MNKSVLTTFVGIAAVAGLVLGALGFASSRAARQSLTDLAAKLDQEASVTSELRSQLAMVSGRMQSRLDEQTQQIWALRQEMSNAVARLTAPAPAPRPAEKTTTVSAAPAAGEAKGSFHTVRQGDILSRIARQYGTTPEAIEKLNPGLNPAKLQIGQKIRVK